MNKTGKTSTHPFSKHGLPWATIEQHGNTPTTNTGQQDPSLPNITWGAAPYTTNQAQQRTYTPALTDGGWPQQHRIDDQQAQQNEKSAPRTSDVDQGILLEWLSAVNAQQRQQHKLQ